MPFIITETRTEDTVHFDRTISLLNEDLTLIVDDYDIDPFADSTIFDIAYHQQGTWSLKSKGKKWNVPNKNAYQYLKETYIKKQ